MEYHNHINIVHTQRPELQQIESKYIQKTLFDQLIDESAQVESQLYSRSESQQFMQSGFETRTGTLNYQNTQLIVQHPIQGKKVIYTNTIMIKKNVCKCQKTQCIKDYCPCHRNNKKCSRSCQCLECKNKEIQFSFKTNIENFWQFSHYLRQ